jgi:hypothetical protein
MGRFKGKPCYYCGDPSVSKEHAPVQQMFKGFKCDSITVPACDRHNSVKSGNDQAIVSALLIPIFNHPEQYSLGEDVKAAVELGRPSFERAKRKALNRSLVKNPSKAMAKLPNVAYLEPSADIYGWVKMLSAALIWDALKNRDESINWNNAVVWSPDWIPSGDSSSLRKEHATAVLLRNRDSRQAASYSWEQGWSAAPRPYPANIYEFRVYLAEGEVAFWHKFYNSYCWYVAIGKVSDATIEGLRLKIVS